MSLRDQVDYATKVYGPGESLEPRLKFQFAVDMVYTTPEGGSGSSASSG